MSAWKSSLKAVLVFSARSTHSSPRTFRRVFMPRSWSAAMVPPSGIGCEGAEEIVGARGVDGDIGSGLAEGAQVFAHALRVHDEACGDRVEEVQRRAERL